MDTSSETDTYSGPRGRGAHRRAAGGAADGQAAGITEKISTLASTLQDTNRNLTKVDLMLGKYREHTDDQATAMAVLKDNLEESINQLQAQRLYRSTRGPRSDSASVSGSLHSNDLEACSGSDGQRFYPTSPPRDYSVTPGGGRRRRRRRRTRAQSATVSFRDADLSGAETHTMHQSLRDLHSDQHRLSDELDREILRRNRSDIDARRAMETLAEHLTSSQSQGEKGVRADFHMQVASRVERRLQELERGMHAERQSAGRGGRPDHGAAMSDDRQETLGRQEVHAQGRREAMETSDRERTKMEQELERAMRLLDQSESSRDALLQQVEDMRGELLRARKTELQRDRLGTLQLSAQRSAHLSDREERRGGERGSDRSDLEREVAELRAQLTKASMYNEVEELKRHLDRKEKERVRLSVQVEELSSDLVRREQEQLRMLEQLKEIQSRGQAERPQMEALLQQSVMSRDELKARAQEAVRQWRAKCKRLQKKLDEATAQLQSHTDKAAQATKEKESSQAQMKALSQQAEAARRELADILGRLAQREEELNRKEIELSETQQRQSSLEQEIREVKEASAALAEDGQHHAVLQARLREENQRLEGRVDAQDRRSQREQAAQAESQATLKELTSARAQLSQRLAEEESSRKELQRTTAELQARLAAAKDERESLGQQLQLEREVHHKELDNLKSAAEAGRNKKGRELQDMLRIWQDVRDEMQAHIKEVEADAAQDKELCGALHIKLDRMKDECDKLAEQLNTKEEAHAALQRKCQLLKQELDDKVTFEECKRDAEEAQREEKTRRREAEQEVILGSVGKELDLACRSLVRDYEDKLQVISQRAGSVRDPHCWLAETKSKLRWLCEEVRERDSRERRLRKQHQQTRDQLKALRRNRDAEQDTLLQRLEHQEKVLHSLSTEKKELLETSQRREEDVRSFQGRVLDLETSTRAALDHLEAIPEKSCLMENFKDLEESQRQSEAARQRYSKCKEIVWDLQHQLDESKRKMQEYQDEKLDATSRSLKLAALSSSIKGSSTLSGSLRSDTVSTHRRLPSPDNDDSMMNGASSLTE
ncbi:centrosomal protein of 128 kDa isoform X2 [Genypterus blacodes]|uniref:centrosomal protein of 128 kDa isoform X2 n=1 Tax=Genypterus blacodes TaxID=154954 RepID=UPI003F75C75E